MLQEDVDIFCRVRDDGSSDDSKNILIEYQKSYPNNIYVTYGDNVGFAKSFYILVRDSGDFQYFAFSDQDDVWLPRKLIEGIKRINGISSKPEMCFCNGEVVDEKLVFKSLMFKSLKLPENKIGSILENKAAGCTIVFNMAARNEFLKGDLDKILYHDFWMYVICSYFGKVVYDQIPRIKYRQHKNNKIGNMPRFHTLWMRRFEQLSNKTYVREYMAIEILSKFDDNLSIDEKKELSIIANYRKSLKKRLVLMVSTRYKFSTFKKNFWFKIHIIIGNV
jgi:glycosyltransferase involved in cell wall biosynthesis